MNMITNDHVKLRALEPSDIELMYSWENDTSIWPVSGTIAPFSRHTMERFVNDSHQDIFTTKQLRFGIDFISTSIKPVTVGYVDIFDFEPVNQRAGVGILIGNISYRRKGLARTALKLLSEYAFNVLHLHQLYCHIHVDNTASIQLFKTAGFSCSGELKDCEPGPYRIFEVHSVVLA